MGGAPVGSLGDKAEAFSLNYTLILYFLIIPYNMRCYVITMKSDWESSKLTHGGEVYKSRSRVG